MNSDVQAHVISALSSGEADFCPLDSLGRAQGRGMWGQELSVAPVAHPRSKTLASSQGILALPNQSSLSTESKIKKRDKINLKVVEAMAYTSSP